MYALLWQHSHLALKAAEAVHAHPTTRIISEDKHHADITYGHWIMLTDIERLPAITEPIKRARVLFKHSTCCT